MTENISWHSHSLKGIGFLLFQAAWDLALQRAGDPAVLLRREAPPCGREAADTCGANGASPSRRPVPGLLRWAGKLDTGLFPPRRPHRAGSSIRHSSGERDLLAEAVHVHVRGTHHVAVALEPAPPALPGPALGAVAVAALRHTGRTSFARPRWSTQFTSTSCLGCADREPTEG